MEKVSHTPGPWIENGSSDWYPDRHETRVAASWIVIRSDSADQDVAIVMEELSYFDRADELLANAALIAAAPDLLSALQGIMAKLDDGRDAPGHCHDRPGIWDDDNGDKAGHPCEWCAHWNAARAAIAKALPAAQGDGE